MWEFESEILFIVTSSVTSKGVFWVNIHIQGGIGSQAHKGNVIMVLGYPNHNHCRNGLFCPKTNPFVV